MSKPQSRLGGACAILAALLCAASVRAQTFAEALVAARRVDVGYSVKMAEVSTQRLQSRQAAWAFAPSGSITYTQKDSGSASRGSYGVGVVQPLVSYDRYLQYKQSDPLGVLAEAAARLAEGDLTIRVYLAMADIVRNREAIRTAGVLIDSLDTQYKRAQRMRELGQGTVTEVSDFEVRLSVAQANRLSQQNSLQAAQRNFTQITGLLPQPATLSLDDASSAPDDRPLDDLMIQVRRGEPSVVLATQKLEIARIASKRSWAQYLPTLSAQANRSQTIGSAAVDSSSVGITLSAPLGAATYFEQQTSSVALDQARENLRAAEQTAVASLINLHASVRSLEGEARIRQRAVEAAHQAVEGNVKSYQGGVKSNIDVLTSYQNLADAEAAVVNARLSQGEVLLRLQLLLDRPLLPAN